MHADRWEHGSEFHWPGLPTTAPAPPAWPTARFTSCGRDALRLIIAFGVRERGWRRLWVPAYFCQEVVDALLSTGIELDAYSDHPLNAVPPVPDAVAGDAVLVVAYFGLRATLPMPRRDGVAIIEDHSHDPTGPAASASEADYCIASLRKTIPVPDGGVLWSPCGHPLPPAPAVTREAAAAAASKLAAMIMKSMYLNGYDIDKTRLRALAAEGEAALGRGEIAAMSEVTQALLAGLPLEAWRSTRRENHALLRQLLEPVPWARVLAADDPAAAPSSCVLVFDSAARQQQVRARLIDKRVYPAVLWPLERARLPVDDGIRDLSRRILSIHCDGRYSSDDMRRVARLIRGAGGPQELGRSEAAGGSQRREARVAGRR